MIRFPAIAVAAAFLAATGCGPEVVDGPVFARIVVRTSDPGRVDIRVGDRRVATLPVASTALDRVEARWHTRQQSLAVVLHHGEHGGASLMVVDRNGRWRVLHRTAPQQGGQRLTRRMGHPQVPGRCHEFP